MNAYKALISVLENKTISAAAVQLGYTQSAVSQMIAKLEEELGFSLLIRSKAGCQLTAEGQQILPEIQLLLQQEERLRKRAKNILGLENAVIKIGTIASISTHWLPQLMADFQKQYPKVSFILQQGDYTSIQEWIKSRKIDFGFINPQASLQLKTIELATTPLLAILPHGHPLAESPIIQLDDLKNESFILLEEGHYNEVLEAYRELELNPTISYTIHDDHTIMSMVEAGLGVSILAELMLRKVNYKIIQRPIEPPIYRPMSIAFTNRTELPLACQGFIEYIIANKHLLC